MVIRTQRSGGGDKKHGRNLEKCARYRRHNTRYKNKIKRITQSSGVEAAQRYRLAHLRGLRAAL